jgi:hypothetical protein
LRPPKYKIQKSCVGKRMLAPCGFAASPKMGPRATVGTLWTGYPHVQDLRRARRVLAHSHVPHDIGLRLSAHMSSGVATRPVAPAPGGSGAVMRPVVPAPASRLGTARVPPHTPWRQLPPPSSGAAMYPVALALASRLRAARVPPHVPRRFADHGLSKYTNIP